MEHRSIGPLSVSTVGLGCNNFGRRLDGNDSASVVHAALDAGINFFDTADIYGYGDHDHSGTGQSERFLGAALAGRRDEAIIATKFGISMSKTDATMRGGGRAWVRRACDDSLSRLGVDHVDLYQMHRPDRDTHISETLAALSELIEAGKVRVIGCSNFSAEQLREAAAVADELSVPMFASVQNDYSLLQREAESDALAACGDLGLAFLPYFPLASGLLTGKYRRGQAIPEGARLSWWEQPRPDQRAEDDVLDVVERLIEVAEQRGHTLLELAFSWLLSRTRVASVIAGATSADQVRSNVAAATWRLSSEDLAAVDAAY
jgi:aryl-alcohol dehydrogenase-like predicted oxidoreductase